MRSHPSSPHQDREAVRFSAERRLSAPERLSIPSIRRIGRSQVLRPATLRVTRCANADGIGAPAGRCHAPASGALAGSYRSRHRLGHDTEPCSRRHPVGGHRREHPAAHSTCAHGPMGCLGPRRDDGRRLDRRKLKTVARPTPERRGCAGDVTWRPSPLGKPPVDADRAEPELPPPSANCENSRSRTSSHASPTATPGKPSRTASWVVQNDRVALPSAAVATRNATVRAGVLHPRPEVDQ